MFTHSLISRTVPSTPRPLRKHRAYARGIAGAVLLAALVPPAAHAQSAIWLANPASGDWNTAANWSGATVPNSATAQAVFGTSSTVGLSLSANAQVDSLTFNSGASAFTFTAPASLGLTLSGAGIVNNSGTTQSFVTTAGGHLSYGSVTFTNSASAGSQTVFDNYSSGSSTGVTLFRGSSTASSSTLRNHAAIDSDVGGGHTVFFDQSTAASSIIISEGGGFAVFQDNATADIATITNNPGGSTNFLGSSTAANAVITNYGGGTGFGDNSSAGNSTITSYGGTTNGANGARTLFYTNATAGNSTLIAYGGTNGGNGAVITFENNATGGTARVQLLGNSVMLASNLNGSGLSLGSIEGTGTIYIGSKTLTVGSNNLSTTFSGSITDNGASGNLVKIGTGTLTLAGANVLGGSITISGGTLLIDPPSGGVSFGYGPVTVSSGGTLAGANLVFGPTTVQAGGHLSPGNSVGTLTFQSGLTLASGSAFDFSLGTVSDRIDVNGTLTGPAGTGGLTLNLSNSGGFAPGVSYMLFSFTTGQSFDVADFTFGSLIGTTVASDYSLSFAGNSLQLMYNGSGSAIPEPATYVLFAGAAALGCAVWRRRRSCS